MRSGATEGRVPGDLPRSERQPSALSGFGNRVLLALTLVVMVTALGISSSLVVYTAWLHDLKNGAFALVFAVLSAQIALNWFLWRDESDPEDR